MQLKEVQEIKTNVGIEDLKKKNIKLFFPLPTGTQNIAFPF